MLALETNGLTKLYPNGKGVRDINLAVERGEIFGFLGPNGAGKSTTIRTLMGFLTPTRGTARVLGCDIVKEGLEVRRRVGYLPSDFSLYPELSGRANIDFSLRVRGVGPERVQPLAERLEVELDRPVKGLSRGQKQKVAIIAALAHDPELLIFDEPTTALDPLAQEIFHQLLREEVVRGKTVFMSPHVLSEVVEGPPLLRWLMLYGLVDANQLIEVGGFPWAGLLVGLALGLLGLGLAERAFTRQEVQR